MTGSSPKHRSFALAIGVLCLAGCSKADDKTTVAPEKAETAAAAQKEKKAAAPNSAAYGDGLLAYPDDLQITMLAYRLSGRQPPLEDWAGEDNDVRRADEFSKAAKLQEATSRLASIYEATDNVGYLQYRLNSQISQYDSAKGGYYLTAFAPGQQTTFNGREPVSIQLENMSDAFFWAMDAQQAQEILAQTGRNVSIDVKLRITGTERRSSGIVLKGRITDYGVYGGRYNDERLLAQFSLN